jgi:hypothetical protein
MLAWLQNHPFAVEAFFERSLVLTFAVPRAAVESLLPVCLKPDTFLDCWAFVAVALVQTRQLRPKGLPALLGQDFSLIGYRAFVRYTNAAGKRRRGLYILKSETDRKRMQLLGNLFTHYHYSTTDVTWQERGNQLAITSHQSRLYIAITEPASLEVPLPPQSPFTTWQEARRFAGPLPFTFSFDAASQQVLLVEGVRQNWQPQPVVVETCQVGFLDDLALDGIILANAFMLRQVPYHWQKGRQELWTR